MGGSGVTHLHVGGDIYCRGLGDLGLGVNLAQTLSQLRVLGQSLKKHPVCGEFTAQIKDINGIKVTSPISMSEMFPRAKSCFYTNVCYHRDRKPHLILITDYPGAECGDY